MKKTATVLLAGDVILAPTWSAAQQAIVKSPPDTMAREIGRAK